MIQERIKGIGTFRANSKDHHLRQNEDIEINRCKHCAAETNYFINGFINDRLVREYPGFDPSSLHPDTHYYVQGVSTPNCSKRTTPLLPMKTAWHNSIKYYLEFCCTFIT